MDSSSNSYSKIIILSLLVVILLRLIEFFLIKVQHPETSQLFFYEFIGLLVDIVITAGILLIASPIYNYFFLKNPKLSYWGFLIALMIFSVLNLIQLTYFSYQLLPLDIFIYNFKIKEIYYTIKTSGINLLPLLTTIIFLAIILLGLHRLLQNKNLNFYFLRKPTLALTSVFISLLVIYFNRRDDNNLRKSKITYFIQQSISSLLSSKKEYSVDFCKINYQNLNHHKSFISGEYPLLHQADTIDVLGPLCNKFDNKPNIVILIIEGLNDDYIHNYRGIKLMPFLDSLQDKSLYWKKCFTVGERSFAVVPSIMGALPYGEKGFNFLPQFPTHLSLVSILKHQGYFTSYFHGTAGWFHHNDAFFNANQIDFQLDNSKFNSKYHKIIVGKDNYFWGYHDKDLFAQSMDILDSIRNSTRLDIYFTETTHSPFYITDTSLYESRLQKLMDEKQINTADRNFFEANKKFILPILFLDDALKQYFDCMQKRQDFNNTIFFITGDHPMSELPRENLLKRYHVPLIVYSPKIKQNYIFDQTASHLDIYQSVLNFLRPYGVNSPTWTTSLGSTLNCSNKSKEYPIFFMNDNREVIDYLYKDYYLSADKLFNVGSDLTISESKDQSIKKRMQQELNSFQTISLYSTLENKLLSDSLYLAGINFHLIKQTKFLSPKPIQSEFFNIFENTILNNKEALVKIDVKADPDQYKNLNFVVQLVDQKDSTVYWNSYKIEAEQKENKLNINIPKVQLNIKSYTSKIYIWNNDKKEIKFNTLSAEIWQ